MNRKTYHSLRTLFAAGALLLTAACSNDETDDFYAAHPDAVRFGVTIGATPATRVNTEGNGTKFNTGDRIGISADGGTSYTTYELPSEGSEWTPADGARYLKWKEQTLSFKAYYPVTEGTSYSSFQIPSDQSELSILRKADYMLAEAIDQTAGAAVPLTFKHQLAKVTVILTPGDEAEGETVSRVDVNVKGSIIENGIVTDKSTTSANVYSYKKDANTFIAILPPQEAKPDEKFITLYAASPSSKEYTLTGIPKLEKGTAYTLNLQVGHDGVKLGGITVEEWNTQEMSEGDAVDPTAWDGTYPTSADEAKEWMGTETSGASASDGRKHVFTITAARQLAALHYLVVNNATLANAISYASYDWASYKLEADIDLNNRPWTPIGYGNTITPYSGIFDGQGHTIRGMNVTGNYQYNGFFANVEGVVKHLNVKGTVASTCTDGDVSSGGIAGKVDQGTNVSCIAFCSFEGTIASASNFDENAGGIAGELGTGKILSCYTVVTAMDLTGSRAHNKGGIAGTVKNASVIKGCYWQELTGVNSHYGSGTPSDTQGIGGCFTDAPGDNGLIDPMNNATPTGYDYKWQRGPNNYPVLVKKQP